MKTIRLYVNPLVSLLITAIIFSFSCDLFHLMEESSCTWIVCIPFTPSVSIGFGIFQTTNLDSIWKTKSKYTRFSKG